MLVNLHNRLETKSESKGKSGSLIPLKERQFNGHQIRPVKEKAAAIRGMPGIGIFPWKPNPAIIKSTIDTHGQWQKTCLDFPETIPYIR
ncbi:MAG: hypothetical protein ACJAZR_002724, partial [Sediminicola sp.]